MPYVAARARPLRPLAAAPCRHYIAAILSIGFFPKLVWPIDIADTRGQMTLFDRIIADHWRTTVIDLGHGLFDQFFKVMAEINFEDEARSHLIQPIVLFITDSAPFTAQSY